MVERTAIMYMRQISDLDEATAVAVLGKALHGSLVDLLVTFILLCYFKNTLSLQWDGLQLYGQVDLVVKEAREAKIVEYLTTTFKASLKAATKGRSLGGRSTGKTCCSPPIWTSLSKRSQKQIPRLLHTFGF